MLVSVIIPYKEDRGFLDEAIQSVEQQSYKNWELILSQSEASGGYNMNRGIEKATGDYICYLCDDDLLTQDSLKHRVNGMKDYDFIHSRGKVFGNQTGEWPFTNPYAQLNSMLMENGIMGGTTMYKREVLEEFMWDETLWTAGEYELHLRLLYNGKRLGFVNNYSYLYRRHNNQKSVGSMEYQRQRQAEIERIRNLYR